MSNNDKFIRDTEFGKLMKNREPSRTCLKCKHFEKETCIAAFEICVEIRNSYFAKDETNELSLITPQNDRPK